MADLRAWLKDFRSSRAAPHYPSGTLQGRGRIDTSHCMRAQGPEHEGDALAASPGTDDPPDLPARSHASAEAGRPADAGAWRPKTCPEHFQESGFADRELAIEAYEHVPARFRQPFELTSGTLDSLVAMTLERAEATLAAGQFERLEVIVNDASGAIRSLVDSASAIIHGTVRTMEQSEIDALLEP